MISPMARNDQRQPWLSMSQTASGNRMSWPAEDPAPRRPRTSPRRASNQRAAITAAAGMLAPPPPAAIRIPAVTYRCQRDPTQDERTAPTPSTAQERTSTQRALQRSASVPAMGLTAPSSSHDTAATPDTVARSQWNSASMGRMNTPKTWRSPEVATMMATTAPRTIQA